MSQIQHSPLQDPSVSQEHEHTGIVFPCSVFSHLQLSGSTSGYFLFVGIMGALNHSFRAFSVENAASSAPFKNREWETQQMDVTSPREVKKGQEQSPRSTFSSSWLSWKDKSSLFLSARQSSPRKLGEFLPSGGRGFFTQPQSHPQTSHPKIPAAFSRDLQMFPLPSHRFTPEVHTTHRGWSKSSELTPPGFPEE